MFIDEAGSSQRRAYYALVPRRHLFHIVTIFLRFFAHIASPHWEVSSPRQLHVFVCACACVCVCVFVCAWMCVFVGVFVLD